MSSNLVVNSVNTAKTSQLAKPVAENNVATSLQNKRKINDTEKVLLGLCGLAALSVAAITMKGKFKPQNVSQIKTINPEELETIIKNKLKKFSPSQCEKGSEKITKLTNNRTKVEYSILDKSNGLEKVNKDILVFDENGNVLNRVIIGKIDGVLKNVTSYKGEKALDPRAISDMYNPDFFVKQVNIEPNEIKILKAKNGEEIIHSIERYNNKDIDSIATYRNTGLLEKSFGTYNFLSPAFAKNAHHVGTSHQIYLYDKNNKFVGIRKVITGRDGETQHIFLQPNKTPTKYKIGEVPFDKSFLTRSYGDLLG